MKASLKLIGLIAAIFLFALLVDQIKPLKQLDTFLKAHPQPWIGLSLGAVVFGLGLLLFAWIDWGFLTGRPMDEEEAREFMSTSAGLTRTKLVFGGQAVGIKTPKGVASFREIKNAFRSGAWLSDAGMRAFCAGLVGLLLLALGGFGYFFVIGSPTVKVMCAGVLLYVFGRTAWEFWKS
jgi:hypothetical protein